MSSPNFLGRGHGSVIFDPSDPARLECGVFKRVQVVMSPLGGTLITWEIESGFNAEEPWHFYVDFGRPGTTEWEPLNTTPIIDSCVYADIRQRYFDHISDVYYRVRLVIPGTPCQVHLSQPTQANGLWEKRDWLIARDIIRREYLYQRKRTNQTDVFYLLKRRRWGKPCSECLEYDTGEVQSECDTCYGTRFQGGYYKAVDMRITLDAPWGRGFRLDEKNPIALTNNVSRKGRSIAYPHLDTRDVLVRRMNGERYYVAAIENVAEVGGVPIITGVQMNLAPSTDIIYTIPLAGGTSSSSSLSSSSQSSQSCAGEGLTQENDW